MADETLKIDANNKVVAGAVTNDASQNIRMLRIDDATKGLKVMVVGGSGTGTVTTVSVVSANGVSGSVATPTSTPAITLSLGAITPSSVAASGAVTGSNLSGTNTGDQTITLTGVVTGTGTGTFATAIQSSIALTGSPTTTTQASSDNSTNIATTAYVTTAVSNALAGVQPQQAVQWATTAAGNTSGLTYNNGVSGVGATLTGANNTAVTIDGHTFVIGDVGVTRLLVKNDTQAPSGAFNGVYLFTALQTAGTGAIFTRAVNYNTPSEMNNSGLIPVENGTANANTTWVQTATIVTVGTTALVFAQFSYSPTSIIAPSLGGTGVANNSAMTVTGSGNFAYTRTLTNTTNVTFPTAGTLQTTTGTPAGFVIASQATGDILYASSASAWARLGVGTTGQLLQANTGAAPSYTTPTFPVAATPTTRKIIVSDGTNWVASTETYAVPGTSGNVLTSNGTNWTSATPSAGAMTLLKANSGTSTTTSGHDMDTFAVTGLTAKDTLVIYGTVSTLTQGAATTAIRNTTDGVYPGNTNTTLTAGQTLVFEFILRQSQEANTAVIGLGKSGKSNTGGDADITGVVNLRSVTFTTAWTGSWTLGFYNGGVTSGGTLRWSWSVYKVAGQ